MNQRINMIDRQSLQVLTSFGDGGRQPGQFFGVHSIATDSKGNLYTTETYEGKRLQKFAYKGIKPVTAGYQGVVRPGATGKWSGFQRLGLIVGGGSSGHQATPT